MRAVITGGSSGLGAEIMDQLLDNGFEACFDWSRPAVDLRDFSEVKAAAAKLAEGKIDVLVNCAGVTDIDFLPELTPERWDDIMAVNARAIFYTTQALLDRLRGGTILNIVSNAAHVPMTSSLAYNASKAAALMMTKQLARELKKTHDITVFSISPNKLVGTGMSKYIDKRVCELRGWSREEAQAYQLAALPAGEETDPAVLAEFIAFLLAKKERHKYLVGCDIPYGGP